MTVTKEERKIIEVQGYVLKGGEPRKRYFTPDGREVFSAPAIREYVRKDAKGNNIGTGIRDANYDKGWLDTPPANPKLYCPHCDRWHDTKVEVNKCGARKKALDTKYMKLARKAIKQDDERVAQLETELSELKGMMKQLIGGLTNGGLFQSQGNGNAKDTDKSFESSAGEDEEGV